MGILLREGFRGMRLVRAYELSGSFYIRFSYVFDYIGCCFGIILD